VFRAEDAADRDTVGVHAVDQMSVLAVDAGVVGQDTDAPAAEQAPVRGRLPVHPRAHRDARNQPGPGGRRCATTQGAGGHPRGAHRTRCQ
jgi:hypothetical protein